ncbi:MAG: hypothetical protein Q9161_007871 [Pseudevernia consocians]
MLGFAALCLLALFQYTFIRNVLSAPYLATRNPTSSRLNTLPNVSLPITLHPPNITYPLEEFGIKYHVPNTMTTLYFRLGFHCNEAGMRNTVNSARTYCEQQLQHEGDGPLPISEDPFHENLGYGAAINVVSSRPDHRLTWGILKDAMNGLWGFLVLQGRYLECEFDICHGEVDLVGRGTIREAPETGLARQSRKRKFSDSSGLVYTLID